MLFLTSQKLILASQQGYFPDLNRLIQSVSRFSRDNYTPPLPINSPPEAQEEERRKNTRIRHAHRQRETAKQRSILLLPRIQRIQRTASLIRVLIPKIFLSRNLRNQARRNSPSGGSLRSNKRVLPTFCSPIPRTRREGNPIDRIVKGTKWSRADHTPIDTLLQNLRGDLLVIFCVTCNLAPRYFFL